MTMIRKVLGGAILLAAAAGWAYLHRSLPTMQVVTLPPHNTLKTGPSSFAIFSMRRWSASSSAVSWRSLPGGSGLRAMRLRAAARPAMSGIRSDWIACLRGLGSTTS